MNTYYISLIVLGYREIKVKTVGKKKCSPVLVLKKLTLGGGEAKHIQTDITLHCNKKR